MDFDTKAFELWYNGNKVDLGTGNYLRSGGIGQLTTVLSLIEKGYSGNVTIERFMLYPDCDEGFVNVSCSALLIDENTEHKTDIDLPTVGINGTTINWSTSDDTVISANGEVYRGNTIKQATIIECKVQFIN